ncbi:hypothetical protein N2152v2_010733 [Parachlorella kessleri]
MVPGVQLPARAVGRQQQRASAARPVFGSSFMKGSGKHFAGQTQQLHAANAPSASSSRRMTAMAAKVTGLIKLALPAGKANPAPPVGPALGSKGVNIMAFCKEYNAATQDKVGTIIPVEITVYEDRSFTFVLKTPPASVLLKKAAGVETGSGEPNRKKVGNVTMEQVKAVGEAGVQQVAVGEGGSPVEGKEIAQTKLPDLNCTDLDAAVQTIMGTARNMGITVDA